MTARARRPLHERFKLLWEGTRATIEPEAHIAARILDGISPNDAEDRSYVESHLIRYVETYRVLRRHVRGGRALDVGSYGTLVPMLVKDFQLEQVVCTDTGPPGRPHEKCEATLHSTGESISYERHFFDVERDTFPFPDASFDVVLFTEILEHLAVDPMHAMSEINRVLVPGGIVVITTPNVAGIRSIMDLLRGFHPFNYSTYDRGGSHNRHNREYAPREVKLLLEDAGFFVSELYAREVWRPSRRLERALVLALNQLDARVNVEYLGDNLFAVGMKQGSVRQRWPDYLYGA